MRWWSWVAAAGGAALVAYVVTRPRYSYGGAPLRPGVDRDPAHLVPEFADKLERVFRRMRARGFQPLLWEGYRTPARVTELSEGADAPGVATSLHPYGIAADIVDASTAPNYWGGTAAFWAALGEEVVREGLTWGGSFGDKYHVQLIPTRAEHAFRATHAKLVYG